MQTTRRTLDRPVPIGERCDRLLRASRRVDLVNRGRRRKGRGERDAVALVLRNDEIRISRSGRRAVYGRLDDGRLPETPAANDALWMYPLAWEVPSAPRGTNPRDADHASLAS